MNNLCPRTRTKFENLSAFHSIKRVTSVISRVASTPDVSKSDSGRSLCTAQETTHDTMWRTNKWKVKVQGGEFRRGGGGLHNGYSSTREKSRVTFARQFSLSGCAGVELLADAHCPRESQGGRDLSLQRGLGADYSGCSPARRSRTFQEWLFRLVILPVWLYNERCYLRRFWDTRDATFSYDDIFRFSPTATNLSYLDARCLYYGMTERRLQLASLSRKFIGPGVFNDAPFQWDSIGLNHKLNKFILQWNRWQFYSNLLYIRHYLQLLVVIYYLLLMPLQFSWFWYKKVSDRLSNLTEFFPSSKHFAGIENDSIIRWTQLSDVYISNNVKNRFYHLIV